MTEALRILLTNKARGWTGETAYVRMLARGLAASGCEVRVAARAGSMLAVKLADDRIPVDILRLEDGARRLGSLWSDARACRRLARGFAPQILHTNASWDSWTAAGAFCALRNPALRIRTKHNLKRVRTTLPNRLLYRRVLEHLIAPSAPVQAHLLASGLAAPERLHLVWYGIDLERYRTTTARRAECRRRLLERFPPAPEALLAVYVSRLTERKHPEHAIEAIRALSAKGCGRPVRLVLAGNDATECGGRCRVLAGADPGIVFLGFQEDVRPILAGADLFLLPAPEEAFGMAVIEAMAAGVPPVLPASGAFPHLVRHGETGLLYDPGAPVGGLADALERLQAEEPLRERLARAAREAAAFYAQERMVAETLALYRRLLAERALRG